MNRRVFVKSGALSFVTLGLAPSFLRRSVFASELARGAATFGNARGKVLICLFQRGAADALNMIVPHGDAYVRASLRRTATRKTTWRAERPTTRELARAG